MCVLCGELINSFHWTDANDGSSGSLRVQNALISANENVRERKRARLKWVGLLNKVLAFYGLKIHDWQGTKLMLCDQKGQSVIVNDLGDLWDKAQNLAKKEMDALDSNLLAFLNHYTNTIY
ncbi:hypothetical protein [Helicobacter acinonychis]|uniref:hypothetical protein n=1 Tax=Helicobacter acinonychis TaxID=212 RepID=UPI000CF171F3|nr:hypothetical protein [Helicobacter acinonychis]STP04331.1 Uncharacterised protein [Helicobacter acinonychis]